MKSFLQGKKSLSVEPLRTPAAATPAPAHPRHDHGRGQGHAHASAVSGLHVDVVKEGDKVVRLVVTCGCGEKVEIECLYSAGR